MTSQTLRCIYTLLHSDPMSDGNSDGAKKKVLRRGTPFTIYFTPEQTELLNTIARDRHVSKTTLVRLAVDHLLISLERGQWRLPLGIEEPSDLG